VTKITAEDITYIHNIISGHRNVYVVYAEVRWYYKPMYKCFNYNNMYVY